MLKCVSHTFVTCSVCICVCQMTPYANVSVSSSTVVDMKVLRIIIHNEVKQNSHPCVDLCAQDVVTTVLLKIYYL